MSFILLLHVETIQGVSKEIGRCFATISVGKKLTSVQGLYRISYMTITIQLAIIQDLSAL